MRRIDAPAPEAHVNTGDQPSDGQSDENDEAFVDDLVGELFREVDDRFSDLERQYQQARDDLTHTDPERIDDGVDPVQASAARFELVSEAATLRAEVERQAEELDERDRMLEELSQQIEGFEDRLQAGAAAEKEAATLKQELHDERRELARVEALLEARGAEREELADATQRLQRDKDKADEMLATAVARFDEVDRVRSELAENLARLESAREDEATAHQARFDEVAELRSQVRALREQLDEVTAARDDAFKRADRSESLVERRANEVNYLNRRIEALTGRADESDGLAAELKALREANTLLERSNTELERDLEVQTANAAASAAAVEAIAERSAQYDTLVARIKELEADAKRAPVEPVLVQGPTELQSLAERARALGTKRTSQEVDQPEAEVLSPAPVADAPPTAEPAAPAPAEPEAAEPATPDGDVEVEPAVTPAKPGTFSTTASLPRIGDEPAADVAPEPEPEPRPAPEPEPEAQPAPSDPDAISPELPMIDDHGQLLDHETARGPELDAPLLADAAPAAPSTPAADVGFSLDASGPSATGGRRRLVLPADMQPDTPEALEHLLAQAGVVAVVDARSFCGRTGVRPSELFDRLAALRDRFDLPIDVVVTPVSTPVGGAPNLPAIGVHEVRGSDTVSDRVRALCIAYPADQPLVVVAGDDHVRRAAIGEEANVVDPAVVLDIT